MIDRLQMYVEWLQADPLDFVIYMAYTIAVVLISLILHECAHGYVALKCGDPTAKMLGRLSLNPLRHLDPIGTLSMFLLGFGWAKPVPVNPRNFRDLRRDDFFVSIAGIVTNLTLCIVSLVLATVVHCFLWEKNFIILYKDVFGSAEGLMNVFGSSEASSWALNIAYGGSFEGLEVYMRNGWLLYVQRFLLLLADVNLGLAIFNLLPVPPLDGFHLLNDTILKGRLQLDGQLFRITQVILIVLMLSGTLNTVLFAANEFVGSALVRTIMMIGGQL